MNIVDRLNGAKLRFDYRANKFCNRKAIIKIPAPLFEEMLNLRRDVLIDHVQYCHACDYVEVFVHSETLESVQEGAMAPHVSLEELQKEE